MITLPCGDFVRPRKHLGLTIYKSQLGTALLIEYHKWAFKLVTWALHIPQPVFPLIWLSVFTK